MMRGFSFTHFCNNKGWNVELYKVVNNRIKKDLSRIFTQQEQNKIRRITSPVFAVREKIADVCVTEDTEYIIPFKSQKGRRDIVCRKYLDDRKVCIFLVNKEWYGYFEPTAVWLELDWEEFIREAVIMSFHEQRLISLNKQ